MNQERENEIFRKRCYELENKIVTILNSGYSENEGIVVLIKIVSDLTDLNEDPVKALNAVVRVLLNFKSKYYAQTHPAEE